MVSDRRVPEFRITQSTSVTFCIISVTKFPVTQQEASFTFFNTITLINKKINHKKKN